MAEAVAAIGLASSILTFVQVTTKVMERMADFKRSAEQAPRTLEHLFVQLPLLVELIEHIRADCDQRLHSGRNYTDVAARRDQQLSGAVEGLRRQVETLDRLIISWYPSKPGLFHSLKKTIGSFAKDKEILAIEQRLETYKSLLTLNFSIPIADPQSSRKPELRSYNVLPRHVSRFVGRGKVIDEILSYHEAENDLRGHKIVALQGMGGQGKTQTALEYCHRFISNKSNSKIVWIESWSPAAALRSFNQIHALMFPSENPHMDQKDKRTAVLQEITTWTCPWLLVFDNYDKPNLFGNITENFPQGTGGALLFTTRSIQAAQRLGHCIRLAGMDADDAIDLFLYRSGHGKESVEKKEASKIVHRLGFLPLAIDQAAAYIKARRLPLPEFWAHFNSRREKVLSETPSSNWEYRRTSIDNEAEKSLSVFTTWELSLEEFKAGLVENEFVEKFLSLASVFDSSTISEMLFKHMTEAAIADRTTNKENGWLQAFVTNKKWDKFAFQDVVAQCYELSLLQTFNIDGSRTTFTLHPLIADWLRLRKTAEAGWQTIQDAASMVASLITHHEDSDQAMCNRYPFDLKTSWEIVSYIDDCLRNESTVRETDSGLSLDAICLEAFASMYWALDKFYEARELLTRAVELHNAERGQEDPLTLVATHSLGEVRSHLDELDGAEELFTTVLTFRKRSLGSNDKQLLETQYHLGVINRRRGDYGPALSSFRSCINAVETQDIDPHRAIDWYASLGGTLARTSQVEEAESVLKKALEMCTAAGLEHQVEYLWPLNWLVRLLCVLDRTVEASNISSATRGKVIDQFGPTSWEACFANDIAGVLAWKRGELKAAKETLQGCLETYLQKYDNNFDVDEILGVTYALGEINREQGNLAAAHKLLLSAADGYERMCGVGTSTALDALGALLEVLVKEKDTSTLEQTLSRIELTLNRTFDRQAPFVLGVSVHMAHAYLFLEKDDLARVLLEEAASGYAKVQGHDHKRARDVQAELKRL